MRRSNTWQNVMTTGEAELDVGDGVKLRLPLISNLAAAKAYTDAAKVAAAADATAKANSLGDFRTLAEGESLDTVLAQGRYSQPYPDRALLSLGYPVESSGYMVTYKWNFASTHVVQLYYPLDHPAFYSRMIYSSTPRPWRKHEDAADTRAYVDEQVGLVGASVQTVNPPATKPRTIVEHTEPGHPFYVASGTAGSWDLNDTSTYAVGSQSIRFTTDGAGTSAGFKADNIGPIDLTNADLQLWIKVDDWTPNAGISIYIGTPGLRDYYQWGLDSPNERVYLQAGAWHLLTIPFIGYNKVANTPDRANLTHMKFAVKDNKSAPMTVHMGPIYTIPKSPKFPNGVVSFSFDDTLESQYTQARPTMDKYGFGGTAYVNSEIVGSSGRTTMAQLRQMQDWSGWEIAGHSYTSAAHNDRFTTLTETALDTELETLAQWLKDNRFNGTSVAYPGGSYNDLVSRVTLRHFKAGRTISPFFETLPPGNPGTLNTAVYVLSGTTTVEHMKTAVDQAWNEGYWLHMVFHDILPVPIDTTDYPTAEFDQICAYIAAKGIPMRTVGDVLSEVL